MNSNIGTEPIIHGHNLCCVYQRDQEKVEALRNVNLTISQGTITITFGPSGEGKSTLLHLLGSIDRTTSCSLNEYNPGKISAGNLLLDKKRLMKLRLNGCTKIFTEVYKERCMQLWL